MKKYVLLALIAGLLVTGEAKSQEGGIVHANQDTLVLTWEKAWEMALERNESHQMALNEVEKGRLQVREAYSAALPTVDFNGVFNHYFEIPSTIFQLPAAMSPTGQPLRVKTQFGSENNVSADVQLTQPVWMAGKVGLGLRIAKNFREISQLGVQVSREDLRVRLVEAYFGAMLAEENVVLASEAVDQAVNYREQLEAMFDEGMVSEYDLIRARVAVTNLQPQVSQAEELRDLAQMGVKNLIGMDVDRPIKITGDFESAAAPPELSYENARELALDRRLELQQLGLQEELYRDEETIHKRSWIWPNLMVGLRWETMAQSDDMEFQKYEFLNGFGGQVILNIPLFDGFSSDSKAQLARVNRRNTRMQRQMLERGVQVEVYEALRTYERSTEDLTAAIQNREQAEKGYEIAEARYTGGVGTQLEVLDAQLQYNQSRVNVLRARYDQLVAKAKYNRAVGKGFQQLNEN